MCVIRSILENDMYKFSMSHYYQVNFPNAWGTFSFQDRNNTKYTDEFVSILKEEFKNLDKLFLQKAEFDWFVKNIPYIHVIFGSGCRDLDFIIMISMCGWMKITICILKLVI